MTRHEAIDPSFGLLLELDAPVRQLGTGYLFLEGPVWHPVDQHLVFSDIPGDVRRRWDGSGVIEVARPTRNGNGMTYDADLRLVVCEHASSSVSRFDRDGTRTELATHFEGRELNSPNDVVVRSDGSVYFTDPLYGRMRDYGVEREPELDFQGVYRVPPGGGDVELVVGRTTFAQPNGLCFSPDEKLLYVNDTDHADIHVYDVDVDGALHNNRIFATDIRADDDPGLPDGMKCDEYGNIWVTAPGGLWVFAEDGRQVGSVRTPERVANFHWGGPDWRTLFLAASTSLYAVDTKVRPHQEPFMPSAGLQRL